MAEMKLTVLMDNNTYIDRYYLGEPAACYLLETGERTILLDTGYSACTLENARRMGVDLSRVTDIVLSHGHDDHTGGLLPFRSRCASLRTRMHFCPSALTVVPSACRSIPQHFPRMRNSAFPAGLPNLRRACCSLAKFRARICSKRRP